MLAYRTDDDAARLLAEQLERETAEVWRENIVLATRLARLEASRDAALERLAEAGPGAGRPSARRDRIGLGALALLVFAIGAMALQVELLCAFSSTPDATMLPVLALLGVPGAIAAGVGHRYRRRSIVSRVAFVFGAAIAIGSLLWIAVCGGRA